jgi:hypothetical protein
LQSRIAKNYGSSPINKAFGFCTGKGSREQRAERGAESKEHRIKQRTEWKARRAEIRDQRSEIKDQRTECRAECIEHRARESVHLRAKVAAFSVLVL